MSHSARGVCMCLRKAASSWNEGLGRFRGRQVQQASATRGPVGCSSSDPMCFAESNKASSIQ